MAETGVFRQVYVAGRDSPQNIRLDSRVRDETREATVDSVKIVTFHVVRNHAISGDDDRTCKNADLEGRLMQIKPYRVECTTHVEPVGRTNHAFVAETEDLAASDEIEPAFC